MSEPNKDLLHDLTILGSTLETVATMHGLVLYPNLIQKSIQPLVGAPMIPCCYGGGAACVAQGGPGTSHHLPGYGHPNPHISELGGRPEPTTKFPYKSKLEEYAAAGKPASVEAIEMPKVAVSLSSTKDVSPLGTPYVDPMGLKIPKRRHDQFQFDQPIKLPNVGLCTYAGCNTGNQAFAKTPDGQNYPFRGATPVENTSPVYGPWRGLPSQAVMQAPKEIVNVMTKSLTDSPYVPASGYEFQHKDYVEALIAGGWCVFVVGGAVRDALVGVVSKDVDIVTDAPFADMENIVMRKVGGQQSNYFPYGALIQMGSDKQRALDITCLRSGNVWFSESQIVAGNISRDTIYRDFSCNALYYDPLNKTLIDPTGRGIKDSVNKILYPSCPVGQEEEWLRNPRLGLRFFKMLYKGYKPSPEILNLLTPQAIAAQCKTERGSRGESYFNKIGHWLLYRQLCGDLFYGTGASYHDSPASVKQKYRTRMNTLRTRITENGYGNIWQEWVYPMLHKHIEISP